MPGRETNLNSNFLMCRDVANVLYFFALRRGAHARFGVFWVRLSVRGLFGGVDFCSFGFVLVCTGGLISWVGVCGRSALGGWCLMFLPGMQGMGWSVRFLRVDRRFTGCCAGGGGDA